MNRLLAVGIASVFALTLTSCAAPANDTACKLYEDAYNQMADAVVAFQDGTVESEFVRAQNDLVPSRMQDAFDQATGDVAVTMRESLELAEAAAADPLSSDLGVAFLLSTDDVVEACAADGASISLTDFSQ